MVSSRLGALITSQQSGNYNTSQQAKHFCEWVSLDVIEEQERYNGYPMFLSLPSKSI